MLTATIRIASGPEAGRAIEITTAPKVFGRVKPADVVIHWAPMTSSRHFTVHREGNHFVLTDLHSTNGTCVNGQSVHSIELSHGDRIEAGGTVFEFAVDATNRSLDAPEPVATASQTQPATRQAAQFNPYTTLPGRSGSAPPPVQSKANDTQQLTAELKLVQDGFACVSGTDVSQPAAMTVASRFGTLDGCHWIVDFSRVGMPVPADVDVATSQLFDWIPAEVASQSPQLLSAAAVADFESLVEEVWGNDAIIGLVCESGTEELLQLLRELISDGVNPRMGKGLTGICWPSILTALLKNEDSRMRTSLYEKVQLVLTETADAGWQLLLPEALLDRVADLEIVLRDAESS